MARVVLDTAAICNLVRPAIITGPRRTSAFTLLGGIAANHGGRRWSSDVYGCDETHLEFDKTMRKLPRAFDWRENLPHYYHKRAAADAKMQEVLSAVILPPKFAVRLFLSRKLRREAAAALANGRGDPLAAAAAASAAQPQVELQKGWSQHRAARRSYLRRVSRAVMSIANGEVDLVPPSVSERAEIGTPAHAAGARSDLFDAGRAPSLWRIDRIDADLERGLLVFCVPRDPTGLLLSCGAAAAAAATRPTMQEGASRMVAKPPETDGDAVVVAESSLAMNNAEAPQIELEMLASRIRRTLPRILKTKKSLLPRITFFRTDLQTEFALDVADHENKHGSIDSYGTNDTFNPETN